MIDQTINSIRLKTKRVFVSFGPGMFGCKDTQVQAKIVARQLQTMSVVDLFVKSLDGGGGRSLRYEVVFSVSDDKRGLASTPFGSSEINSMASRNSMRGKGENWGNSGSCTDTSIRITLASYASKYQ